MVAKKITVDDYISDFDSLTQSKLKEVRKAINAAVPEAEEVISYRMPAYKIGSGRPLVFFAGFKNHIGFFPLPAAIKKFEKELTKYKHAKGSIQFPLDKPMPLELITKIVKFRAQEKKVK